MDYVHFLPSIGTQRKSIRFIVKTGQRASLRSYADLQGKVIGVKRGTAYFDPFDSDNSLQTSLASATTAMPTTSTSNPLVTITVPRSATIWVTKRPSTSSWDSRGAACARVARLPASTTATVSCHPRPKSSELPAFPVVRSTVVNPTVH